MLTEENKAVARRIAKEIWNERKLELVDELVDSNWVYHGTGGVEFKGREGFRQFVTTFIAAFPDFHVTVDDMIAEEDEVASRITARGNHQGDFMGIAATGRQFTIQGITIHRFAGGREAECWQVTDQLGMMQQLGVVPPK